MLVAQVILCVVLLLGGVGLLVLGWRGLRQRLPRNRYVGVRTPAALRSDDAFAVANRAAGPAMLAGGGVAVLAGVSVPALAAPLSLALVGVLGVVGAFVLMTIGGVAGHRAAAAMPEPAADPCDGCFFAGACGGTGAHAGQPGCAAETPTH